MADPTILCTHCQVELTSWSAPGSPIRYYQCPFCARTHASCYGDLLRRGAVARRSALTTRAPGSNAPPQASQDQIRWAGIKARAARWFARLEADEAGSAWRRAAPAPANQVPIRAGAVASAARPARHR
jgi:hypothetical protein